MTDEEFKTLSKKVGISRRGLFKAAGVGAVASLAGASILSDIAQSAEVRKVNQNKVSFQFECDGVPQIFHYEGAGDALRLSWFQNETLVSTASLTAAPSQLIFTLNQDLKFLKVTFTKPNTGTAPVTDLQVILETDGKKTSFPAPASDPLLPAFVTIGINGFVGRGFIDFSGLELSRALQASNRKLRNDLRAAWGTIVPDSIKPGLLELTEVMCCWSVTRVGKRCRYGWIGTGSVFDELACCNPGLSGGPGSCPEIDAEEEPCCLD